ncbi:MAG: RNA-directed DNA polymerase [Bacteroidales bacterium]|nr:RNA-directed DNA polymerase [Bacteroidales bacterium]
MKRIGKVWHKFCDKETCKEAIWNAAKGKRKYRKVRKLVGDGRDSEELDRAAGRLSELLRSGRFEPSEPSPKVIKTEYGKEREIFPAPFFPDCCVHHGVALMLRERWTKALTDDTYACVRGRGINCRVARHNMGRKLRRALARYRRKRLYGGKDDILKCYPSTDNGELHRVNLRYCKDRLMNALLRKLNYRHKGLAIGSYMSQLWINLLLNEVDRFAKETLRIKYYFRYMDDIVILAEDKRQLHEWQRRIMSFLWNRLRYELNNKRQVFPVGGNRRERGIDFGGYVFRRGSALLRKRIKKSFARRRHNPRSVASYWGLLKHCDSRNLIHKVLEKDNEHMRKLTDLGIRVERRFDGEKIAIDGIVDKRIVLLDFELRQSIKKADSTFVMMQIAFEGKKRFVKGGYKFIAAALQRVDHSDLPLETVIRSDKGFYFEGTVDTSVDIDMAE